MDPHRWESILMDSHRWKIDSHRWDPWKIDGDPWDLNPGARNLQDSFQDSLQDILPRFLPSFFQDLRRLTNSLVPGSANWKSGISNWTKEIQIEQYHTKTFKHYFVHFSWQNLNPKRLEKTTKESVETTKQELENALQPAVILSKSWRIFLNSHQQLYLLNSAVDGSTTQPPSF